MELTAHLVSTILTALTAKADIGVSLLELDALAEKLIRDQGAIPYNKGYKPKWALNPYPATLCTNVNSAIAHGVPTDYKLQNGDILNIDLGLKIKDLCGDAALTIPIGELDNRNQRLLWNAKMACYAGIEVCRAGIDVIEIGKAIEKFANSRGFVVNENMAGHKIGKEMHEKPSIPHFAAREDEKEKYSAILNEGDVICIEPMLTYKDNQGAMQTDGWTLKTKDGKNSAMFEHMVLIKKDGYEILTSHFGKEMYN